MFNDLYINAEPQLAPCRPDAPVDIADVAMGISVDNSCTRVELIGVPLLEDHFAQFTYRKAS